MARMPFHKLFYDKQKLYTLVNLRRNGYAYTSLALIFKCDVSSVRHQCDKYMVVPEEEIYTIERIATEVITDLSGFTTAERITAHVLRQLKPYVSQPVRWEEADGTRYAMGKSYQEYLAEAGYPHRKLE